MGSLDGKAGFLRLRQIIGIAADKDGALLPISRSAWWAGIRSGRYPKGIKLGARTTVWRVEDIRELIAKISGGAA